MSKEDRGMMKWMPYKSLTEQEEFLAAMRQKKNKSPKPIIFEDQAEEINEILTNYDGEEVIAKIWKDGYSKTEQGKIEKIDPRRKAIWLNGSRIDFASLYRLEKA